MTPTARQVTPTTGHDVARWCGGTWNPHTHTITIHTRHGELTANEGDWIHDAQPGKAGAFYTLTDTEHKAQQQK